MTRDVAVVLAVLALAVALAWSLWRRPYRRCRSCKGTGRVEGSGKRYGFCPACKGKPPKRRFGAAAVAALVGERYGRRYW